MRKKITDFVKPHNIGKTTCRLHYIDKFQQDIIDGGIYQFGVWSGTSIDNILQKYKEFNLLNRNVYGFDSFCGLPKETAEALYDPAWNEGEFSSCDYLDVNDPKIAAKIIEKQLQEKYPDFNIKMIEGFFCDSFKNFTEATKASWVDIDVDIYSSAKETLEFLYQNQIFQIGTLVYYDDWKNEGLGEGRAHKEFCNKYHNIKFDHIYGSGERLFKIKEVNYDA